MWSNLYTWFIMRTGYNQFSSYPRNPRKHPKMDIAPRGSFYKEWDPVQTGHVHQADLSFWKESPTEQSEGGIGREGLEGGLRPTHGAQQKWNTERLQDVLSLRGIAVQKGWIHAENSVSKREHFLILKSFTLWINLKKLQNYLKIVLRVLGSDILSLLTLNKLKQLEALTPTIHRLPREVMLASAAEWKVMASKLTSSTSELNSEKRRSKLWHMSSLQTWASVSSNWASSGSDSLEEVHTIHMCQGI